MENELTNVSLVESLRSTSAEALENQARVDRLRQQEAARATARRAKQLEAAAQQFVALYLEPTITELVGQASRSAQSGRVEVIKEWEVACALPSLEIEAELKKRTALRDAVAAHFTGLNFEVGTLDYRRQFQHTYETYGRSDDGYYPTEPREFVTGLVLSWGGQEA